MIFPSTSVFSLTYSYVNPANEPMCYSQLTTKLLLSNFNLSILFDFWPFHSWLIQLITVLSSLFSREIFLLLVQGPLDYETFSNLFRCTGLATLLGRRLAGRGRSFLLCRTSVAFQATCLWTLFSRFHEFSWILRVASFRRLLSLILLSWQFPVRVLHTFSFKGFNVEILLFSDPLFPFVPPPLAEQSQITSF